jgi:streptogramin lyase
MKLALSLAATLALGTVGLFGANQSWTGTISDSMCGISHPAATPAKQCTNGCVKKGAKYVVVAGGKVYNVANQEEPGLMKYAGDKVKVTGKLDGDTITVVKIKKV